MNFALAVIYGASEGLNLNRPGSLQNDMLIAVICIADTLSST